MGLALALASSLLVNAALRWPAAAPARLPVVRLEAETAVESAALLGLGMRRLEADLSLVRLLIYYGSPEGDEPPGEHHDFDPEHPEHSWGGGRYPELSLRARRILDLDPAFSYPVLIVAGVLAFNLNRPGEALDLISFALSRDPRNPHYQAYAGAIAFHKKGDAEGVIRLLEPRLQDPDCPTMIKNMVAFLYRRTGRREKAAALYRDIMETSRDAGYRASAARILKSL